MKAGFAIFLILIGLYCKVDAKIFGKCEFARFLRDNGVSRTYIPHWVCLSEAESNFDSSMSKVTNNKFSTRYGIFQINSKTGTQWCNEVTKGGECRAKCSDFLDDKLDDDLNCALKVFKAEGFKNWPMWERKCKGRDQIIASNVVRCFNRRRRGSSLSFLSDV